jgi:hypothetical protein
MSYYDNLLQLSIKNQAVIYNLDHSDANEEVEFIYNTDQFVDLDNFVDTGFTNAVSSDFEEGNAKYVHNSIVLSNEKNTLHLKREDNREIGAS